MLPEWESRVLSIAMDAFLKDFEPREAVAYLESKFIFNDDQIEAICNMPRRLLRVQEFFRQYRKSASSLDPLISFFRQYGQQHLANALIVSDDLGERPLLTEKRLISLLLQSHVPSRLKNYVERKDLLEGLKKSLQELSSRDQFWLVVHGMAGSGKSCLAAEVLRSFPEILSRYYEHIVWVHDGNSSLNALPSLYANFFVFITDSVVLTGHESFALIQSQVRGALLNKPNALIVIDDVILEDCIRWFDQLQCRILATSRNLEIFQASRGDVVYYAMPSKGFTLSEISTFLSMMFTEEISPSLVARVSDLTGGLPAVLNIMAQLARNNVERFKWLCNQLSVCSLNSLDCITSYRYSNMEHAIFSSFNKLSSAQKEVLSIFIVFPAGEWIPVEAIALISPVDISNQEDSIFATVQVLENLAKCSMIFEREIKEDYISYFDYCVHPIMANFISKTVVKEKNFARHLSLVLANRIESALSHCRETGRELRLRNFNEKFGSWIKRDSHEGAGLESQIASLSIRPSPSTASALPPKKQWRDSCFFM